MTLQEILDEIAERYPHALDNSSVIRKINNLQTELYRTIYKSVTADIYDITADQVFYPVDFSLNNIIDVLVDGVKIPRRDVNREGGTRFYYFFGNSVALYPTPEEDIDGGLTILRNATPTTLSSGNLSASPDFDSDFHMILVYGTLAQIAEVDENADMVNNFTAKYNGMIDEFYKANDEYPEYPTIDNVMGVLS